MGRFTHCRDCTVCRGTGWRDVMKPNHTGCRDCGGNDRVAGKGGRMQIVRRYTILSCPRCRTDYDGC
jgi:hypothetical protein